MSFDTRVSPSSGPHNPQGKSLYAPAGTGETKWLSGDVYTIKASAETTNGALGFIEASVPPGGGPAPHVHDREDEAFYLLSGELEMLDGDETFTAKSGDFIFVPRGSLHRFKNMGLHTTRLLFMYMPAGFEAAFSKGGDDPTPGIAPPPWDSARFERFQETIDRLDLGTQMYPE
jgi:mannose-6-phosphate isomerase-like protein (cupin superfamily)